MFEALVKGLTLGILLSISVGPIVFSILKQSLNNGHKGGVAFIIGVSISDIALVLISNVFTELFASINKHREIIGITGSLFLITVGIYYLFFKKIKVDDGGKQVFKFRKRDYLKITASGFFMNTLNPAVIIFWLTTSTAIITDSINQRLIIFITCLSFVLMADFTKVMLAGKIRNRLTPHNIHIINRINGVILICFGLVLVYGLIYYADRLAA